MEFDAGARATPTVRRRAAFTGQGTPAEAAQAQSGRISADAQREGNEVCLRAALRPAAANFAASLSGRARAGRSQLAPQSHPAERTAQGAEPALAGWGAQSAQKCAVTGGSARSGAEAGMLLPQTVKKPGRFREGRSPLELQSNPAACTPDSRQFLRRRACPSGEEIASLQFPRPEMRSISAETGRGGSLPGELAPPSTSLFDKQREGRPCGLPSRLSMYASCGCAARRAGCQRLLCGVKPSPSASRTSVAITKACSSHSDMMRLSCSTSVR